MVEILVLGEQDERGLDPITGELLAAARKLGGEVGVTLFGNGTEGAPGRAVSLGADTVYVVQHPLLASPSTDAWVTALEQVCRRTLPRVVIVGKTELGRDVGPRVAFRLGVGLAQDCVAVKVDPETSRVVADRPVYGGNAVARVTFGDADPQVVSIRPRSHDPFAEDSERRGETVRMDVELDPSVVRVRHVETVHKKSGGVRLQDASVVVSGGRGLGGPEPFKLVEELAELLGGAVGASRAACDAGWIDHSRQVGLTGTTVTPNLYITIGISGASQHMAGCSGAKHIVAVNKDPEANIFKEASFGVVGDWGKVLPSFIGAVRDLVRS